MKNIKHALILLGAAAVFASASFIPTSESHAQWFSFKKLEVTGCDHGYDNAKAHMLLIQHGGKSTVFITVSKAPPRHVFTIWLKLAGTSPLTGIGATALANPSDIAELATITPDVNLTPAAKALGLVGDDGSGSKRAANGFTTNRAGFGLFVARYDFPIIRGAYQFQEFDSSLSPVPIGNSPFTLRLITHCTDNVAHGLIPGVHEPFFDWSFD